MSRVWDKTPKKAVSSLRPFGGEILPIELDDILYFKERYQIAGSISGRYIKLSPTTQRYILPILSPEGWARGLVLRLPWPKAPRTVPDLPFSLPKADTYMSRYEPVQSFYPSALSADDTHDGLIVVEDQLSAIKLANHGFPSVALLGTPWSKDPAGFQHADRVAEIAEVAGRREVIVAFDADATAESFEFARKWGPAFHKSRVVILFADLKDTDYNEFGRILGV